MKDILFTRDILAQAAKETGFSIEKVEYVYKSMIKHLHNMIRFTDAVSIFIPFLGVLYMKAHTMYRVMEKTKSKRVIAANLAKKKKLHDYFDKRFAEEGYPLTRHTQKPRLALIRYTDGLSIKEIEKIQNETEK